MVASENQNDLIVSGTKGRAFRGATLIRRCRTFVTDGRAGLVSEIAGRIPAAGESIEQEGLRFEVLSATGRRIDRLRVSLVPPKPTDAAKVENQAAKD